MRHQRSGTAVKKTEAYRDARGRSSGYGAGGSNVAAYTARAKTPPLRRLKLHGIKRQKVPKIQGLKKHQKNHSLACQKSRRF